TTPGSSCTANASTTSGRDSSRMSSASTASSSQSARRVTCPIGAPLYTPLHRYRHLDGSSPAGRPRRDRGTALISPPHTSQIAIPDNNHRAAASRTYRCPVAADRCLVRLSAACTSAHSSTERIGSHWPWATSLPLWVRIPLSSGRLITRRRFAGTQPSDTRSLPLESTYFSPATRPL